MVPPHVKTIRYLAFAECPRLHKITLPASVTSLGGLIFDKTPLDTLILECAVPPTLSEEENFPTFNDYTATLIVPAGAAETYRQHPIWGLFMNIVEDETVGIKDIDDLRFDSNAWYDLQGRRIVNHRSAHGDASYLKKLPKGLYIRGNKKIMKQ